jgi:hypothetical protein
MGTLLAALLLRKRLGLRVEVHFPRLYRGQQEEGSWGAERNCAKVLAGVQERPPPALLA